MINSSKLSLAARMGVAALFLVASAVWAQVKIAVTDLTYQEQVAQYFNSVEFKGKWDDSGSARERYRDSDFSSSGSASANYKSKGEMAYRAESGVRLVIDRGELRKFTGDIKGGLIKAGYRVMQGKPWTQTNTEQLYDIIKRVKEGYYPGSDYVLFGTITSIEFREEHNPIQGTNTVNHSLNLELVAEFSLINTKTYEIKAAFSAIGEGSDSRLTNNAGTVYALKRGEVMYQVAKSLGDNVTEEVLGQFSEGAKPKSGGRTQGGMQRNETVVEEKTIIFK